MCKLFSNSTLHVSTFYKTFLFIASVKTSKMQEVSLGLGVVTRYLVVVISYQLVARVYAGLILLIRTRNRNKDSRSVAFEGETNQN